MCGTCGCGHSDAPSADHGEHSHDGPHEIEARRIVVERSLLEDNDARAETLRKRLGEHGIEAIGLLGGPGAGKTALLEATLSQLGSAAANEAVVEGDCATDHDARRVAALGARVVQVETGALCHLDAHLVGHAVAKLDLDGVARLWIENVGNLVCPAPFACGENRRAVLISVTEGDDKPEKYPAMLAAADLLVISKTDLLPYVPFDLKRAIAAARQIRPELPVLPLSSQSGEGLDAWMDWLSEGRT
ncbi:MAG: hydrogenase nickel incorporation protein HypB [bacterium]|nr:hydrogenase nickel incorporation protein HypB [bacterium]